MKNYYMIYDGVKLDSLTHIPEISCYNSNYYIGLKRANSVCNDIIYADSDDDNTTTLYDISGGGKKEIGECFVDEDDIIHVF